MQTRPTLLAVAALLFAATAARGEGAETSTAAPVAPAEQRSDGPVLDIGGIDEEVLRGASSTVTSGHEGEDPFAGRVDPLATLSDRAAAILDRTTIGGYGEVAFFTGASETATFQHHRFVVFLYSKITDHISTATEVEFEFAGSPLKRDGVLGHGEALLEFAVIDFELMPWLVFRAGVILMPMGALNLRHDSPTQDLTDRPIAYESVVPSTWFETGAGLLGKIPVGEEHRITYELYAVNGLDARIYDGPGFRGARGSHLEDNNGDKGIVGRLAWSPSLRFELGLSGYTGAYDLQDRRVNMGNVDLTLKLGKLELLGEAVYAAVDEGYVEGFTASSPANTRDAVPTGMAGFYAQANYHFIIPPLWDLFPDWLKEATFTGILRYEGKDTDLDRHSGLGDRRRLTFGLNFRPAEPYVLKTDYQLNSKGIDETRGAPDIWQSEFWEAPEFRFLASVAFLF